jgi:hypothetical protein
VQVSWISGKGNKRLPSAILICDSLNDGQFEGCNGVVALVSASISLLSPVLRISWKVPKPPCNCLSSLSNFRWAAAIGPRKACYLPNFSKNSQLSGECPVETGSHMTAHTTSQSHQTAEIAVGRKHAVSAAIFVGIVPLF